MKKCFLLISLFCFMLYFTGCSSEDDLQEETDNPYFYNTDYIDLWATAEYYELETKERSPIGIKVYLVKIYKQGKLYKFAMQPIDGLEDARTNIYFYVTSEKIYRIWGYIRQDEKLIEFYDNDELIVKYLDTDEKLIENGEIVCQCEEITKENEEGSNVSISVFEDKVVYSRCDIKVNGEPGFYEWFVWEHNNGLTDYRSGFGAERDILYLEQIMENAGERTVCK